MAEELRRRFTTSVKKFVQDVESDHTRDGVIGISDKIRIGTDQVTKSYATVKQALNLLHQDYEDSKTNRNILNKYKAYKNIIKSVIRYDSQYWILVEIPKQEKQETLSTYVLRCCSSIEKATENSREPKSKEDLEREAQQEKDRKDRFNSLSIPEIEEENKTAITDLYRLMKKYTALRNIVHDLKGTYVDAKVYPFMPRYIMLKDMIKSVLRNPAYMEVCHEKDEATT